MRTTTLTLLLLLTKMTWGQTALSSVARIDSLAKHIDAIGKRQVISDGVIRPAKKKKVVGGFSDSYYVDTVSKRLVSVLHEESLFGEEVDVYYFFRDSLILVRTTSTKAANKVDTTTSKGRYYFEHDTLIYRQEDHTPIRHPEAFIKIAKTYIADRETIYPFEKFQGTH